MFRTPTPGVSASHSRGVSATGNASLSSALPVVVLLSDHELDLV